MNKDHFINMAIERRIEKFSKHNTVEKKRNKSSDKANSTLSRPFQ